MTFRFDDSSGTDAACTGTLDLVRRTMAQCGEQGLPQASQQRIRNGLAKMAGRRAARAPAAAAAQVKPAARRRPDRIGLALMVFMLIFLMPAWGLVATALLLAIGAVVFYCGAGHDRACALALAYYRHLMRKDPARAERLRRRAARLSAAADRWAARLPESWTRGLYLPDFEPAEVPEQMRSDPFERLAGESRA